MSNYFSKERKKKHLWVACVIYWLDIQVNLDGEKKDGYKGPHDQICNARLPRALDPHSVPSEELAASLGFVFPMIFVILLLSSLPFPLFLPSFKLLQFQLHFTCQKKSEMCCRIRWVLYLNIYVRCSLNN